MSFPLNMTLVLDSIGTYIFIYLNSLSIYVNQLNLSLSDFALLLALDVSEFIDDDPDNLLELS